MDQEHDTTLRAEIREWWEEQLDTDDPVSVVETAKVGAEHFRKDAEFCARFLDEFLYSVIRDIGGDLIRDRRSEFGAPPLPADTPKDAASAMTPDELAEFVRQTMKPGPAMAIQRRWQQWRERDPATGLQVPLLKMTKAQIAAAKASRQQSGRAEFHRAGLLEQIERKMRDGQTVEEVWTPEELDELNRRIVVGTPRVSLGPVGMRTPALRAAQAMAERQSAAAAD